MPFWTSKRVHDATAPKAGDGRPQHLDQVVRSLEAHVEGQDSQFAKLEARCHALEQALIETREALAAEAASRLALAARVRSFERFALEMVPAPDQAGAIAEAGTAAPAKPVSMVAALDRVQRCFEETEPGRLVAG